MQIPNSSFLFFPFYVSTCVTFRRWLLLLQIKKKSKLLSYCPSLFSLILEMFCNYTCKCLCICGWFPAPTNGNAVASSTGSSAHQEQQEAPVQTARQALSVNCALLVDAGHVIANTPVHIFVVRVYPHCLSACWSSGRSVACTLPAHSIAVRNITLGCFSFSAK